jgi:hypothetical protein
VLRKLTFVVCVPALCLALAQASRASQLLTTEEALNAVFGEGCTITKEDRVLTGDALVRVMNELGGSLHYRYGRRAETASAAAGEEKVPLTFYRAVKDGAEIGVAIIDAQPGKWGNVGFMIAINPNGAVSKVVVMSSNEKRGRPISHSSFLDQYVGKNAGSRLQVRRDITGISGATISSECATFAVKRAVLEYKELYLNTGKNEVARADEPGSADKAVQPGKTGQTEGAGSH